MKAVRIKTRHIWGFNPVTRKVPSKKLYSRSRSKCGQKTQE